uniref:Uncharacterized protein n=1 Tax=Odontella aurita TaxID=265563 RepID=A0A7S4JN76_9STRA|mmetsp:Transcript_5022/g.14432  ORF Transcript_5022/g.14432 Transcript_5022/m.14432 type:complete len:530 (+) Transcript_5022:1113-2702(+)
MKQKNDEETSSSRRVKLRKRKSSSVAEKYLKATEQSSMTLKNSRLTPSEENVVLVEGSVVQLYEEAMELLKYWVVFALMVSILRVASLLPIVGRIISVDNQSKTVSNGTRRWLGKRATESFWSSLKLSSSFVEEVKVVFFVWLRYLPTSLTTTTLDSVRGKAAAWEKKSTGGELPSNRPLDILYQRLAPAAVSAADSSSNLSLATDSDTGIKGLLHQGMKFVKSFLQAAVFMRVISEETKMWIETSLVECSALLPAVVTLLMPGYFTEFGCIYVSKVVPSANSAASYDALNEKYTASSGTLLASDLSSVMRFLKYWVVHSLFTAFLSAFAPLLRWVPLSTHVTWLLWAYMQLELPTNRIYSVLEWELKAFGLLRCHLGDKSEDLKFDKTLTAGMVRSLSSFLPSASTLNGDQEEEKGAKAQVQNDPVLTEVKNENTVEDSVEVHGSALKTKDEVPQNSRDETINGSLSRDDDSNRPRLRVVLPKSCDAQGGTENGPAAMMDSAINMSRQGVIGSSSIDGSSVDDKSKIE